jgi:DNA-binding CsgD family transcriptional regulator
VTTKVELFPDLVERRIRETVELTKLGMSAAVIAVRLNVTPRTVTRYRTRARVSR